MSKLSKKQIIELYKRPSSMSPEEICKYSGYFNSIVTIKRYIQEAIELGEITDEDIEVFRKREEMKRKEKENRKAELKSLVLKKILMYKTRNEIVQEVKIETGIETNTAEIGNLIEILIRENQITEEKYKEIVNTIRQNAIKKTALKNIKRKQQEGLEL